MHSSGSVMSLMFMLFVYPPPRFTDLHAQPLPVAPHPHLDASAHEAGLGHCHQPLHHSGQARAGHQRGWLLFLHHRSDPYTDSQENAVDLIFIDLSKKLYSILVS